MKNRLHDAFDSIRANDRLVQNTLSFLQEKTRPKRIVSIRRAVLALACIAVLVFAGVFSSNQYHDKAAYLDIDANPSIELTLNRFGRVIAVDAYNDEGAALLAAVSVKNKPCKDALEILIDEMVRQGYIEDSGLFSVTVQSDADQNELLSEVESYVDEALNTNDKSVDRQVYAVDEETKTQSHDLHLSPAKYLAITELQELDPAVTVEDCRNHTLSEIHHQIDQCKAAHGSGNGDESGDGSGNGHGASDGSDEHNSGGHSTGSGHGGGSTHHDH